jgi:hypothetical protein
MRSGAYYFPQRGFGGRGPFEVATRSQQRAILFIPTLRIYSRLRVQPSCRGEGVRGRRRV